MFVLFLLLLAPLVCEGHFASVKAMGMGGAAIANPIDTLSGAYNPANMVAVGDRMDLGGGFVFNRGKLTSEGVSRHFSAKNEKYFFYGEFGLNGVWEGWPGTLFSIGLISYPRNVQKRTFDSDKRLFLGSKKSQQLITYTIAPVFALEFCGSLAIGVSLDWQISRLKINGFRHHSFSNSSHFSKDAYSHGVTTTLGFRWQIARWLAVGASYQPKGHMKHFSSSRIYPLRGSIDIPERFGAGIQLACLDCLQFSFDVERIKWQDIHALRPRQLPNFDFSSRFKDQTRYRFGMEYQPFEKWSFRAGYSYATSPLCNADSILSTLAIENMENYLTFGVSYQWSCLREISTYYAYGFKSRAKVKQVESKETRSLFGLAYTWFY